MKEPGEAPGSHGCDARSQEAVDDRAVHHEADRSELLAVEPGDPALLHHAEDREFLRHAGSITEFNRPLRPYRWVDVPHRAVIGRDGGNAAEHIERGAAVRQRAVQALPLRTVLAGLTIGKHENTLDRAEEAVVGAA